ncbi:hypothetical protein D3C76_1709170 [compost metagenome]
MLRTPYSASFMQVMRERNDHDIRPFLDYHLFIIRIMGDSILARNLATFEFICVCHRRCGQLLKLA